ncbi:MAG: hypothetical protein ACXIUW_01010 [Roseinatronobacter sp.]
MAHEKLAEKLGEYYARLGAGKAQKIKRSDVENVLRKLYDRRQKLLEDAARKPDQSSRLEQKISSADTLIARAEWLLSELSTVAPVDETSPFPRQD